MDKREFVDHFHNINQEQATGSHAQKTSTMNTSCGVDIKLKQEPPLQTSLDCVNTGIFYLDMMRPGNIEEMLFGKISNIKIW